MTPPNLHERVARRWSRARRTTAAAVLAAVASLVALVLAAPAGVHAGAIMVAAAVGAAWPQRDRRPAALRWIGARSGLAYETAVEVGERSDRFGLLDAVRTQGRLAVRDVPLPAAATWWLPASLLAATLWTWGAFVGVPWTAPWAPSASAPPTPNGSPFVPPALAEPDEVPSPADAPGADAAVPRSDEASAAGPGEGGAVGDRGGGEGSASERDALERFVEGLREREIEPATAAAVEDGVEDSADAGDEPRGTEGGERDDGAESTATAPDPGGTGDPVDDEAGDGEGAGDESEAEGDDETGDEAGQAGGPGDGAPETGEAEATAGEDGAQAGAAGVDPGEDPGDAGFGVGAEGDASDAVGEDPRAPDALPSILGSGPETPVGGVALPGAEGDGAFPAGTAGAAYRRAVEEALTEGEVPVPYQEVIRNYFR